MSPVVRRSVLAALRRGTVPQQALHLAVGLDRFEAAVDEDLDALKRGDGVFKAVRGEYGTGKTFYVRWLQERARRAGFATSEVQVSETQTPLHRLETVYRRAIERLATRSTMTAALPSVIESWAFRLEQSVIDAGTPERAPGFEAAVEALLEKRLASLSTVQFAAILRAWRRARRANDPETAQGLLAWMSGQPHVGARIKAAAGLTGKMDHYAAMQFITGLLHVLRDAGHPGLLLVLDEVETLQRMRSDSRDKSLDALRKLIDEVHGGDYPGLYLVITGTAAFFEGPQGVQRLAPLAQRLHVDFPANRKFDNPRAVQIRLWPFDHERLVAVGRRVRDLFTSGLQGAQAERVRATCDDAFVADFASAVAGQLGQKVGIAPRIYLKKLVAEILDVVEQHADFDPRRDHRLSIRPIELQAAEREAIGVDDVELRL